MSLLQNNKYSNSLVTNPQQFKQKGSLALARAKTVYGILNDVYSDLGYSGNVYDLNYATRKGIIYPSLDPSIFEVKFPNQDIKGRVVSY